MRMRTNEIRKYITSKLKTLGVNVYFHEASDSSTFPFIVYDLKSISLNGMSLYDFEVNVWDKSLNRSTIEDLADNIEDLLDNDINIDSNGLLVFDKVSRGNINDPNKDLNRVMIKFDMRYFK